MDRKEIFNILNQTVSVIQKSNSRLLSNDVAQKNQPENLIRFIRFIRNLNFNNYRDWIKLEEFGLTSAVLESYADGYSVINECKEIRVLDAHTHRQFLKVCNYIKQQISSLEVKQLQGILLLEEFIHILRYGVKEPAEMADFEDLKLFLEELKVIKMSETPIVSNINKANLISIGEKYFGDSYIRKKKPYLDIPYGIMGEIEAIYSYFREFIENFEWNKGRVTASYKKIISKVEFYWAEQEKETSLDDLKEHLEILLHSDLNNVSDLEKIKYCHDRTHIYSKYLGRGEYLGDMHRLRAISYDDYNEFSKAYRFVSSKIRNSLTPRLTKYNSDSPDVINRC